MREVEYDVLANEGMRAKLREEVERKRENLESDMRRQRKVLLQEERFNFKIKKNKRPRLLLG